MSNRSSVRILSLRRAINPRNSILVYAVCQSTSRPNKLNHNVTKKSRKYFCTCEASALGGYICRHIRAVRARVTKLAKAAA
jgi:SWIM zinc finger